MLLKWHFWYLKMLKMQKNYGIHLNVDCWWDDAFEMTCLMIPCLSNKMLKSQKNFLSNLNQNIFLKMLLVISYCIVILTKIKWLLQGMMEKYNELYSFTFHKMNMDETIILPKFVLDNIFICTLIVHYLYLLVP